MLHLKNINLGRNCTRILSENQGFLLMGVFFFCAFCVALGYLYFKQFFKFFPMLHHPITAFVFSVSLHFLSFPVTKLTRKRKGIFFSVPTSFLDMRILSFFFNIKILLLKQTCKEQYSNGTSSVGASNFLRSSQAVSQ